MNKLFKRITAAALSVMMMVGTPFVPLGDILPDLSVKVSAAAADWPDPKYSFYLDLRLINATADVYASAAYTKIIKGDTANPKDPEDTGLTCIHKYNLNEGAGGNTIYLIGKPFEREYVQDYPEGRKKGHSVKDIIIRKGEEYKDQGTIVVDGRKYYKVKGERDAWLDLEQMYGYSPYSSSGNLNTGYNGTTIGSYVYMYYTYDTFPDGRVITDIWFNNNSKNAISGIDLNDGCNEDAPHIYAHASYAHLISCFEEGYGFNPAEGLTYNGKSQTLISARRRMTIGGVWIDFHRGGFPEYRLNDGEWEDGVVTNYDFYGPAASEAGTYKVECRLKGDYGVAASDIETYYITIAKATNNKPKVKIKPYILVGEEYTPELENNISDGEVTYLYSDSWQGGFTTEKPTEYGEYYVKAIIADTNNVAEYTTGSTSYKIRTYYNAKWQNYDGSVLQEHYYKFGDTPEYTGSTPTKPSDEYTYTFSGWKEEVNEKNHDVIYTAQYTAEKSAYTVKWLNLDGTVLHSQYVPLGTNPPAYPYEPPTQAADAQYTYTDFTGWSESTETDTGNITYTAQYKKTTNTYTVTWKNWDDTVLEVDENVPYGTYPEYNGATPTREIEGLPAYTFKGWSPSVTNVKENATYTAEFSNNICGKNTRWVYDDDRSTLTIYGEGETSNFTDLSDNADDRAPWYDHRQQIKNIEIGEGITKIGDHAFHCQYSSDGQPYVVEYVTLPSSIKTIGSYAFGACSNLKSINLEEGLIRISDGAFYRCQFKTVTIPSTVEEIGEDAFRYCGAVTDVYCFADPDVLSWKDDDENDFRSGAATTVHVPADSLNVFKNKFSRSNLAFIGDLPSVEDTYTVTWKNWDGTVLETDTHQVSGIIPVYDAAVPTRADDDSYTYYFIGWDKDITAVTEDVTYTAAYKAILHDHECGDNAYWEYDEETRTLKILGSGDMSYNSIFKSLGFTTLEIGHDITLIRGFRDCEDLTKVYIDYDSELRTIYGGCFMGCRNLPEILIPINVSTIGVNAFYNTNRLHHIYLCPPCARLTTADDMGFKDATIYVSVGQYDIYKSSWQLAEKDNLKFARASLTYLVTWKNDDGTELYSSYIGRNQKTVYKGETPTKPADDQYVYTFIGWDKELGDCTENTTYTAQYSARERSKYTVTWKNYDGTVLETDENILEGTIPTYDGETPTKPDDAQGAYIFTGWSPAVSAVTGNVTYMAQYSAKHKYTVTWKNYDGTVLETDENVLEGTIPTYDGETPTKPEDAQGVYTFTGWSPAVSAVTGDVTYTAQYSTKHRYTVTWKNYDDTVLETDENVLEGTIPTYDGETPTKPEDAQGIYTFCGWSPEVSTVTGNVTYTAQYSIAHKYTVTWKNYDGTVLETDTGVIEGTIPTYDGETPTKPDDDDYSYTFSGWSPDVLAVTGNVTYTAQYIITSGKCGENAYWTLENGKLTISGSGDIDNISGNAPWYEFRDQITSLEISDSIAHIGNNSFKGLSKIISVTLPDNTTTIGDYAFADCSSLTSIVVPQGVDFIDLYVFKNCTSLESVTIPDSLVLIRKGTFYGCDSLTDIYYGGTEEQWNALEKCTIPNGCTVHYEGNEKSYTVTWKNHDGTILETDENIPYHTTPSYDGDTPTRAADEQYIYTFIGWSPEVSAVTSDVTYTAVFDEHQRYYGECGENAYWEFDTQTGKLTISGSGEMYDYSDRGSTHDMAPWYDLRSQVKSVEICDGITKIGKLAFYKCDTLNSVEISADVTSIGVGAFNGCSQLTDIWFDGTKSQWDAIDKPKTNIPSDAVIHYDMLGTCGDNAEWEFDAHTGKLTISGSGEMYDYNRKGQEQPWKTIQTQIITIEIGEYITKIGQKDFADLTNLENVIFEENSQLTIIDYGAFGNCTNLNEISIPDTVEKIACDAFNGCSLTDIYYQGTETQWSAVLIEKNAIPNNCTVHYTGQNEPTTYTITVEESEHGTIIADKTEAAASDEITITAQPEKGYHAVSVSVNGEIDAVTDNGDGTYTFTMPADDVTVTVEFATNEHSITIADEIVNGTVSVESYTANYGDTVTITAEPDNGYSLAKITVTDENGEPVTVTSNTFVMPDSDVTISAEFETSDVIHAQVFYHTLTLEGRIGVNTYLLFSDEAIADAYNYEVEFYRYGELVSSTKLSEVEPVARKKGNVTYYPYPFTVTTVAKETDNSFLMKIKGNLN